MSLRWRWRHARFTSLPRGCTRSSVHRGSLRQVYTHRVPSPFEPCRVAASWPVAPLLVGAGREHEGALALDKERRPSGVHLKDELDALAAGGGP